MPMHRLLTESCRMCEQKVKPILKYTVRKETRDEAIHRVLQVR